MPKLVKIHKDTGLKIVPTKSNEGSSVKKHDDPLKEMKTFKEFLDEKWIIDVTKRKTAFPIFENPTSSDLVALKKSGLVADVVRFIAVLSTQKIYVWAGLEFIHSEALRNLKDAKQIAPNISVQNLEQTLCGECHLKAGELTFSGNDGMDSYFGEIITALKKGATRKDIFIPPPYSDVLGLLNDIDVLLNRYQFVGKTIDRYETESSLALIKNLKEKKK